MTAMHYAIEPSKKFAGQGHRVDIDSIRSLLIADADKSLKDARGLYPHDLAKQNASLLNELFVREEILVCQETLIKKSVPSVDTKAKPYQADADKFLKT